MRDQSVIATRDGFFVKPRTQVPSGIHSTRPGRVLVGHDATIEGGAVVAGSLHTQPRVRIGGPLRVRGNIVLGSSGLIGGSVEAGGDAHVLPATHVRGPVVAGGDVHLFEGARIDGDVIAGGDIVVYGTATMGDARPGGRVRSEAFVESRPAD